tara:strand:+ start:1486 stop:2280 length:795 start_codon:yes stop_codon:yes gene_type:complete
MSAYNITHDMQQLLNSNRKLRHTVIKQELNEEEIIKGQTDTMNQIKSIKQSLNVLMSATSHIEEEITECSMWKKEAIKWKDQYMNLAMSCNKEVIDDNYKSLEKAKEMLIKLNNEMEEQSTSYEKIVMQSKERSKTSRGLMELMKTAIETLVKQKQTVEDDLRDNRHLNEKLIRNYKKQYQEMTFYYQHQLEKVSALTPQQCKDEETWDEQYDPNDKYICDDCGEVVDSNESAIVADFCCNLCYICEQKATEKEHQKCKKDLGL